MKKIIYVIVSVLFLCIQFNTYGKTYYIATTGHDTTNNGMSINAPFLTLNKALAVAVERDSILISSGTYPCKVAISITTNNLTIKGVFNTAGERPIFDFSKKLLIGQYGFRVKAVNCLVYGIIIKGTGDNGMRLDAASYNTIEFCDFVENYDSGLQFKTGSHHNKIINCDSYFNYDSLTNGGNADGFANKLDEGGSNTFIGCRAWQNSDDGWDGLIKTQLYTPYDTLINCWCYKNGYLKSGALSPGNGNGFKLGGNSLIHDNLVVGCLSAMNKQKGFDYNNNMGHMILYNCTGFGNGGTGNFAFPNAVAAGRSIVLKNCLAHNKAAGPIHASAVQSNNSWQSPFVVSDTDFVSIDHTQMLLPRKDDGSLPDITFMHLKSTSDLIDGGTYVGYSYTNANPDLGCFETEGVVAVNDQKIDNEIAKIYPVPASQLINIETYGKDAMIRLFDGQGAEVTSLRISGAQAKYILDVSVFGKGIYMLSLVVQGKHYSQNIIIE